MRRYVRWPLMLGGLLFASYGFIDQAIAPAHAREMWAVRLGTTLVIAAVILRMMRPVGRLQLNSLFSLVALASGAGLLVESWYWADAGRLSSHTGLVILLIYIHVLSRMPFMLVTALGWTISVAYLCVLVLHPAPTMLDVGEQTAAILSANLTGMVASYVLERYSRNTFWQTKSLEERQEELAQQTRALRDTNEYLASAIGEVQRAQASLVQQEKMASLGALTAGIAHEIKNPLNFVNNFSGLNAELLTELRGVLSEDGSQLDEQVTSLLDQLVTNAGRIESHGKRADGIVRSMLAHSRQSSGARVAVDFNALVEEYVGLAYHGFRAREGSVNPVLVRDFAADAGSVEVEPPEIGRVVINLLGNAFDAVAQRAGTAGAGYEPTVTVSTRRRVGKVELRIADNGPGISDEVRDRLFEPFFTTKPPGEGTGLGLSLSYEIVKRHGGTLALTSTVGAGSEFVVTL